MNQTGSTLWRIVKVVAPVAIVAGVGWQFASILRQSELRTVDFAFRPLWLIAAGLLYLLAHTIFATFWVQLLHSQGAKVPWAFGVRAYFISQFGKYLPGKAWVIVMRVTMLRHYAPSRTAVALTATYETLLTMAAGAGVGVALLPFLAEHETVAGREWLVVVIALIPLGFGVLHALVGWLARKYQAGSPELPKLPFLLLLRGLLQASVGWGLLGLSLWLTIQGLSAESSELTLDAWLKMTAVTALSYVIGFVVLVAPGGFGVREYLLQSMLAAESFNAPFAVVVSLVVRLVWTVAEMLAILLLWRFVRPPQGGDAP